MPAGGLVVRRGMRGPPSDLLCRTARWRRARRCLRGGNVDARPASAGERPGGHFQRDLASPAASRALGLRDRYSGRLRGPCCRAELRRLALPGSDRGPDPRLPWAARAGARPRLDLRAGDARLRSSHRDGAHLSGRARRRRQRDPVSDGEDLSVRTGPRARAAVATDRRRRRTSRSRTPCRLGRAARRSCWAVRRRNWQRPGPT